MGVVHWKSLGGNCQGEVVLDPFVTGVLPVQSLVHLLHGFLIQTHC